MTTPRVCSYIRMSTERQDASPDRQRAAIEKYAAGRGYVVTREYSDLGVSGWKDDRPGFRQLITDATSGQWDVILVDEPSRLSRSEPLALIAQTIYPLQQAGVSVEAVSTGPTNWNDLVGLILTVVNADKSSAEVKALSRRVLGGLRQSAAAGGKVGSIPSGYVAVTDPETKQPRLALGSPEVVEAIRWAFENYAAGQVGLTTIAAKLADRGVMSPKTGKPYSQAGLSYMLRNPVYAGDLVWNRKTSGRFHRLAGGQPTVKTQKGTRFNAREDWVLVRDGAPAIVSRDVFQAVQERLKGNKTWTTPHRDGGDFRLTKLLICGRCGSFLYGSHQKEKGGIVYRCSRYAQRRLMGCDSNTVREKPLLQAIGKKLAAEFVHPDTIAMLRAEVARQEQTLHDPLTRETLAKRLADLDGQISRGEERLLELPTDVLAGAVEGVRKLKVEREGVKAELVRIDAQARPTLDLERAIDEITGRIHRLVDILDTGSPADVRAVLQSLVSKVVLHFDRTPAKREGGRTRIVFRGGDIHMIRPDGEPDLNRNADSISQEPPTSWPGGPSSPSSAGSP
ncbi:recombinase family protein [Urbifossiella limnaea]|uniref:Recombinase family protein n=1 Tax=Urbifossiella limnaea TaxID=2528023 RepID=A0A517Y2P5_9BACT|nr:recombinase family protein [Urbifossiella limnaea]QDU24041.1 hypothetical protein ETAA1_60520 [Urbifossiella limnaea]